MLNIGYGNFVIKDHMDGVVRNDGAAIRKYRSTLKNSHKLIDVTLGHKARSIIIMQSGHIFLSAIATETLERRFVDEK